MPHPPACCCWMPPLRAGHSWEFHLTEAKGQLWCEQQPQWLVGPPCTARKLRLWHNFPIPHMVLRIYQSPHSLSVHRVGIYTRLTQLKGQAPWNFKTRNGQYSWEAEWLPDLPGRVGLEYRLSALMLPRCATSCRSLSLPESQLPHWHNEDNRPYCTGLLWGWRETIQM